MRGIFAETAAFLVTTLTELHADCKRLQESSSSGLDDVLEQIAKTEQGLLKHIFGALLDCQPLLSLPGAVAGDAGAAAGRLLGLRRGVL